MAAGNLGWIHFDERDRSQVDELLEAFRKPGMLDELGVGRVRDSFADLLAPGLSTIHTRVRYLLFIPWIFRDLGENELTGRAFFRELKKREIELIDLERVVPSVPYSRDEHRLEDLTRTLLFYRMAFGQPRQQDLVEFLQNKYADLSHEEIHAKVRSYWMDLSAPD